jgi:Cof subfamily protein (haloacid dehalogenase superfamily)
MSGKNGIRLLLADVDGTLVTPDKVLTEAAMGAARALRQAGILLAITSGRPPRGMKALIEPLALQTPIAGFNGGVFSNPDLSTIESHVLEPQIAGQAVELLLGQGLDVWVFTESDWFVRDASAPHVAHEIHTTSLMPSVVTSFTEAQLTGVVKIVGVSDDAALVAAGESRAHDLLGDKASASRSQTYFLDVTHPFANKGVVLTTLSRWLNIPAEQIATIGDMANDVLMFGRSGFSIAMGNASADVKAQARAVTDSNDNEGFAKAVHAFILAPEFA